MTDELIPATAEHVLALFGEPWPVTLRGVTAVSAGRLLGMGIIYVDHGRWILTCRLAPETSADLRAHTRAVLRICHRLLAQAGRTHLPVHAKADPQVPRAGALLVHLGFKPINQEIFEWIPSA